MSHTYYQTRKLLPQKSKFSLSDTLFEKGLYPGVVEPTVSVYHLTFSVFGKKPPTFSHPLLSFQICLPLLVETGG